MGCSAPKAQAGPLSQWRFTGWCNMCQHWSGCNLGHIGLIWGSLAKHRHTQRERERTSQQQTGLRAEACTLVFVFTCDFLERMCTGLCVDRWCDLPSPHPFRSSHRLYPGGKRREPCKGISLYSSLPALPFLFSLFPKHHSCRADAREEKPTHEKRNRLQHCKKTGCKWCIE